MSRALIFCVLLASSNLAAGEPVSEWDSIFDRTAGWTGADCAGTIDLLDGRTLWVFGDTWIGKVAEGQHVGGAELVNNTLALHKTPSNGAVPQSQDVSFAWGPNRDGKPTAWIVPPAKNTWYWGMGGGAVVPGPNGKPRLAIFLFHQGRKGASENSVWNFRTVGGAFAVVENFHEPLDQWKPRQVALTHTISGQQAAVDKSLQETNWGQAAWLAPPEAGGWLYIYGVRELPRDKQALLARVPTAALEQMDRWEFFAGEGKWSPKPADAVALMSGAVSEFSVERFVRDGQETFVMVQSEPRLGKRIFVRTAPTPEGSWSEPQTVHSVTDVDRHREYFSYAAKGHLGLSRPGELLVTYLVNSHDFGAMFRDAAIYRPRFVRISIADIKR